MKKTVLIVLLAAVTFHLQRKVLLVFPQNKTYTHSADLFVQAGEYQSIRNFNNGII